MSQSTKKLLIKFSQNMQNWFCFLKQSVNTSWSVVTNAVKILRRSKCCHLKTSIKIIVLQLQKSTEFSFNSAYFQEKSNFTYLRNHIEWIWIVIHLSFSVFSKQLRFSSLKELLHVTCIHWENQLSPAIKIEK